MKLFLKIMKPLISYYGGKQRIASKVLPHFPKHTVYVEPFAGGAALLFAKDRLKVSNNSVYREVINDIDDALITLYRVAKLQSNEFQALVEATLYSQSEHRKSAEILKNKENYTELEIAWAYYINSNCSFAKTLFAGWGVGVSSENHVYTVNNKTKTLSSRLERLKNLYISNEDFLKCIKRWDSPQTLFYCDPPYPATDQGHYSKEKFNLESWQSLCDTLDSIQGSYVLSGYDNGIEPKTTQNKVLIDTVNSSANGKHRTDKEKLKRTEVLWICDRSDNASEDIQRLFTKYDSEFKEMLHQCP